MSEPEGIYKNSSLKQFSSFEEMNEADAKEMALISPMEHLKNTVIRIKNMYAEELKKPMNKKIKFDE